MKTINIPNKKGASSNAPETLVIHAMSEFIEYEGEVMHAYAFLEKIGLSAHYLITPSGGVIKTRTTTKGAYHAKGFNKNSVGIEVLVSGLNSYSEFLERIEKPYVFDEQMKSTIEISKSVVSYFGIKNIVRHSDISPGRKIDPGNGFPWADFLEEVG